MMAVTVDLQGVITICTHVGFGRRGPLDHATFGSGKGHLKVFARLTFYKLK